MSETRQNTAVMAGAGTGKTYSLVENYLHVLLGLNGPKRRPQEILALTFTQKAALEMRLRVTKQLSELLTLEGKDVSEHPLFNRFSEQPSFDELRRLLRAIPNAPIATFHGFCGSLLRKEARYFGLDERFLILDPSEEKQLARNVLRSQILSELKENSVIKSLVARFRLSNGQISFGLIDSLLDCYFSLSEKGLHPRDLRNLVARKKITQEEIFSSIVDVKDAINHFKSTRLTENAKVRLDEITIAFAHFEQCMTRFNESEIARAFIHLRNAVKGNFGDRSMRWSLVEAIVKLGAQCVDYFVADDEAVLSFIIERFHDEFDRIKCENNKLSYSDLLVKTKEMLEKNHSLRHRIASSINHILIDEYQDTSPIQEDIVALLLANNVSEQRQKLFDTVDFSLGASLFVVGDKKQSIYGFRGADVTLFDYMVQKMSAHESFHKRILSLNRRSTRKIIELTNLVAAHTMHAQGYTSDDDLEPFHINDDGHCALWVPSFDNEEFSCAAFGIADLLSNNNDVSPKDIVVLVRRIKSAASIKDALLKLGIPARIVGGEGFFEQQEIVDLLSALKLINDPRNSLAASVVLRSPLVLLTDNEILLVKQCSDDGINLAAAENALLQGLLSSSSSERLRRFLSALEKIRASLVNNDLAYAANILLHDCDYAYAIGLDDNAEQKWANIEKLRAVFLNSTKNPFLLIEDLYAAIFENNKVPVAVIPVENNAVTIMTIHQSKGLEFDVVVLSDIEASLPKNHGDILADKAIGLALRARGRAISACAPKDQSEKTMCKTRFDFISEEIKEAENKELARLLYVALTRAKKKLYVVSSRESFFNVSERQTMLGLFLRAYHSERDKFLALCDVEFIDTPKMRFSYHIDVPTRKCAFESAPSKIRLFASMLEVDENHEIKKFVDESALRSSSVIDGNLAHQLLFTAANFLAHNDDAEPITLDDALDASLRLNGNFLSAFVGKTLRAVKTTMQMLKKLPSALKIIHEMPLITFPSSDVMVEGFADLVVEYEDFVGVIEFKSSLNLVLDVNTYFQTMAYAYALSSRYLKPVKFAVVLIGEEREIRFIDFSDEVRRVFLDALACCIVPRLDRGS